MKISRMAMAIAVAGLLSGSTAYAQQYGGAGVKQPASAQQVAYNYRSYYADEEPEAPEEEATEEAAEGDHSSYAGSGCTSCNTGCNSCSSGCGSCCCSSCDWCCLGEPWTLFEFCECSPWSVTGFVNGGYTVNLDDPADRFNGPVTFNDRDSEGQLNQAYVMIDRALQNDGCGWGLGAHVDLLYGSDWRFTFARGLEVENNAGVPGGNKISSDDNSFYGLAIPQAYGVIGYNDLSVKVGHFYTIIGYEVVPANGNFFYSHAYTMQYGEPFTHTGALGSFAVNDNITVHGGAVLGWDNWEDENDDISGLAGITWTNCDQDRSLAFAIISGDEDAAGDANRTLYSIVYTRNLNCNWKYVLQHDNGYQDDAVAVAGAAGANDAEWYGINQYLFYTVNDCLSYGVRGEWFRDDDGARVAGLGNTAGTKRRGWTGGGFAGNFYEVSAGINYKPHANVLLRGEARFDWYDGAAGAGGAQPYDNGTDDSQVLLATDAIFTF